MSVAAVALALSGALGPASGSAWGVGARGIPGAGWLGQGESVGWSARTVPLDAFEREAWTRAVALGGAADSEVLAALASEEWSLRRAAADGLARAERRPSGALPADRYG